MRPLLAILLGPALATSLPAEDVSQREVTYQYYRFEPTQISGGNAETQLAEFSFSLQGADVDRSGVLATCGAQDPNGNEGPMKTVDDNPNSKWFKGAPLEPLDFDFGEPVTIDEYNWTSANDSVAFSRNPVSWNFYGSSDGSTWELLDARSGYPIADANFTVQDGFPIPGAILPLVERFGLDDGGEGGVPAIVLNGSSVPLAWTTDYSDSVALSPDPGAVDVDGAVSVTPADNSTVEYTLTAGRSGITETSSSTIRLRSVAGGSASYRYVRFSPTMLRSDDAVIPVQLSEFEFYDGTTPVPVASVSNVTGTSPLNEGPANLIDGAAETKWLNFTHLGSVQFDFGEPTVEEPTPTIDGYAFVTGNDAPGRDPIQWTLEGSDDGVTWTVIEKVDFDYPTPSARTKPTGTLPLPGASLPPTIASFGGAARIIEGEPLTLSWVTSGADSAEIDMAVGVVDPSGFTTVTPPAGDTTYTLTVYSAGGIGSATAEFTVTVIPAPSVTTIDYDDFSSAGTELETLGTARAVDGVLRLTDDTTSQNGAAWFVLRQDLSEGFEASFGFSLNQEPDAGVPPADGFAFVIQNSADGFSATNPGEAEKGLPENALNLSFRSLVTDPASACFEVLAGTEVLASASAWSTPGVELRPLPGYPYSLASPAGTRPYQVRVVYLPGDLDVYLDGIAVIQNLDVDLEAIGAVDPGGMGYAGFTARTGLYYHTTDISGWRVRGGDFSGSLPFGLVRTLPKFDPDSGRLVAYDLVWNAEASGEYDVLGSIDFANWDPLPAVTLLGVDGQLGFRVDVDPEVRPAEFYRVEDLSAP